jgi:hypothetical protein
MTTLIQQLKPKERRGNKPRCHLLTHGPPEAVAAKLTVLVTPSGSDEAPRPRVSDGMGEWHRATQDKDRQLGGIEIMKKLSPALLKRMADMTEEKIEAMRRESQLAEDAHVRERFPNRKRCSGIIVFELHEDDDVMVQEVKRAVNKAQFTLDELYAAIKEPTRSNYYRALRTRHTMTMKNFQAWAELLGLEAVVRLVPRGKS